jgi:copper(I)-binding protein
VAVISEVAARAVIHETSTMGEMRHMSPVSSVVMPARTETRLAPGGTHAMLLDLNKRLRAGDSVTVLLTLSRAGALEARAIVVPYADLQKWLEKKE